MTALHSVRLERWRRVWWCSRTASALVGRGGISVLSLPTALDAAHDALQSELQSRRVHGVLGAVTEAVLGVRSVVFIDPLQLEPRLSRFRRHVIHPSPTLEQQFFVLAEYLGTTSVRSVQTVIRGEEQLRWRRCCDGRW
ncbi:receptor-type adenylate cyclase [Trypanosoma rangeli]|uniref:Receptor-type adenylate cyclase n=1 Tax=Trypanosoma rangeli TaxID=5698 RepID=A0A422MZI5_TRYRA|nr:receptor-type adenylate cyclase [Trypanosoma rangeli]RNE98638.1 receptor-type adenylate cyclase [Trypanosoma rangeli]|eukprot:RNE98638.1 receptor-type adenylate cyclase [Trypanosoma rangeli]